MVYHVLLIIQIEQVSIFPITHGFLLQKIALLFETLRQLLLLIVAVDVPVDFLSVFLLE